VLNGELLPLENANLTSKLVQFILLVSLTNSPAVTKNGCVSTPQAYVNNFIFGLLAVFPKISRPRRTGRRRNTHKMAQNEAQLRKHVPSGGRYVKVQIYTDPSRKLFKEKLS
jgi:hypothetical protein